MSRALSVFSRNSFQPLDPFDVTQGLRFAQGLRHSAISSETGKSSSILLFKRRMQEQEGFARSGLRHGLTPSRETPHPWR